RELAGRCDELGIRLIALRDGRPTTRKVRVIGQQQQLLRIDYEHASAIDAQAEDQVLAAIAREIEHADIIVASDYAKGLLTERLSRALIELAHAMGKLVILDPRPQNASRYTNCDYLTPNWKEAHGLLGWPERAATDE